MIATAFSFDKSHLTASVEETQVLAKQFASILKPGDVVCLKGNLGAGKTHFVKGICAYFGMEESLVQSPTFTLVHEYKAEKASLYHFDCYRLKSEAEARQIGFEEYIYDNGICLIEWPDVVERLLPEYVYWVEIEHAGADKRKISISKNKS